MQFVQIANPHSFVFVSINLSYKHLRYHLLSQAAQARMSH